MNYIMSTDTANDILAVILFFWYLIIHILSNYS